MGGSKLEAVRAILAIRAFQQLIGKKQRLRGWPVADPFLIARAMVTGAVVVTEEKRKGNAAKIPNVCEHFNVDYMTLEDLMAEEGWQF